MIEPIRLAKRVADIAACSRREAELYIEGGWVTVDGKVVIDPPFRVSDQVIALHPDATLAPVELVTILFHQAASDSSAPSAPTPPPIGADNHATDDASGIRVLKRHFARLAPTLPLESGASGLVVFTQDWRVVRKLTDSRSDIEHEYNVEVEGQIRPHGLKQLNHGLSFKGQVLPPAKVSWQSETRLRFAISGVKPGQLTHMCLSVGLRVRSIKRIRIGKISMAKLPPGQWRYLPMDQRF